MNKPIKETAFYKFIIENFEKGSFTNDDIIAVMMPLLKKVSEIHNQGKVASLQDISTIFIDNNRLNIEDIILESKRNLTPISKLFVSKSNAFEITGEVYNSVEIGEETTRNMQTKPFLTIK
jgi:hypothetical protein